MNEEKELMQKIRLQHKKVAEMAIERIGKGAPLSDKEIVKESNILDELITELFTANNIS